MGARTRIRRPTTATPSASKAPPRFLHVSTNYRWIPVSWDNPSGPARFVAVTRGSTYRHKS